MISNCELCSKQKENTKLKRVDSKIFNVCPECSEELKQTIRLLKLSTELTLKKDKNYERNPKNPLCLRLREKVVA